MDDRRLYLNVDIHARPDLEEFLTSRLGGRYQCYPMDCNGLAYCMFLLNDNTRIGYRLRNGIDGRVQLIFEGESAEALYKTVRDEFTGEIISDGHFEKESLPTVHFMKAKSSGKSPEDHMENLRRLLEKKEYKISRFLSTLLIAENDSKSYVDFMNSEDSTVLAVSGDDSLSADVVELFSTKGYGFRKISGLQLPLTW